MFHKVWKDGKAEHPTPKFVFHNADGTIREDANAHLEAFANGKYIYYLRNIGGCYVTEEPMEGYKTTYENPKQRNGGL